MKRHCHHSADRMYQQCTVCACVLQRQSTAATVIEPSDATTAQFPQRTRDTMPTSQHVLAINCHLLLYRCNMHGPVVTETPTARSARRRQHAVAEPLAPRHASTSDIYHYDNDEIDNDDERTATTTRANWATHTVRPITESLRATGIRPADQPTDRTGPTSSSARDSRTTP